MVQPLEEEGVRALQRGHEAMPVELVEVRPGRQLAVHRRVRPGCRDVAFLVHGSCASMLQWLGQLDCLAAAHSVVAFDFLGCGRSPKPVGWGHYACDELFQDFVELVRRFGAAPGDAHNVLVAHSMGCSFALRLAAEGPPRCIRALVLLAPADEKPAAASGPLFRLPLCVLERLQPALSAAFESRALHPQTRDGREPERHEVVALVRATSACNPMHMCKAFYRQLEVPSPQQLGLVRAPALLLHGEADLLVAPAASLRLQGLLADCAPARRLVLPACSHQLMQEQPAAVNAAMAGFLAELQGAEGAPWGPPASSAASGGGAGGAGAGGGAGPEGAPRGPVGCAAQ